MKKKFSVIFILFSLFILINVLSGFMVKNISDLDIKSKSAYLIDYNTKKVIYSKNENEKLPIASMCKIMTLLLTFESIDSGLISSEDIITISHNASSMGGSQVFLEEGEKYPVCDLIKSIVVCSANDSCVAIAETLSGDQQSFVDKMNCRAKELGMENTCFVNCTGLPQAGQFSCAKDCSIMFSELLKHQDYFKYSKIWTDRFSHTNDRFTEISNTNKLIRFYNGCDAGKTGYTSSAGHCLTATALRNGMRLVGVVIAAPDSKTRFNEVSTMFNYGFNNYCNKLIINKEKNLDIKVKIVGGKKDKISVKPKDSFYDFSLKNSKQNYEVDFTPKNKILAPIRIGDKVGVLEIYLNNEKIGEVDVVSNENINKKTYFDCVKDICNSWGLINL